MSLRLWMSLGLCLLPATAFADHELEDRDIENGRALYATQCAACHGAELQGQPDWQTPGSDGVLPAPPHDRTGHTWHHDNQLLFDYVNLGGAAALERRGVLGFNSGMMGFGDVLSEAEIWDILAYIRSTWPQDVQEVQASRNPPHEED
nr:cytochrome c [Gymnodinialimonas ceratoperidinii]